MTEIELLRTENKELKEIIKKQEERERRLRQKVGSLEKQLSGSIANNRRLKKKIEKGTKK